MEQPNRTALTPAQEKMAIKQIKENESIQKERFKEEHKIRSRELSLMQAPIERFDTSGIAILLTASERIAEAEIIYRWLTKYIK